MVKSLTDSLVVNVCEAADGSLTQDGVRHVKTLPFLSVVQAMVGEYEISLDGGGRFHTGEGGCFIAPAGIVQDIVHRLSPKDQMMRVRWVFLDIRAGGMVDIFQFFNLPQKILPSESEPFERLIAELLELQKQADTFIKATVKHRIAFQLLELLISVSTLKEKEYQEQLSCLERLAPAMKLMDPGGHVEVADLARAAGLSVSRFHALFKSAVGTSPMVYLSEKRLSKACLLLLTTSMSIAEISEAVGFCDQFHFSKAFRAKFACSPMKYRNICVNRDKN